MVVKKWGGRFSEAWSLIFRDILIAGKLNCFALNSLRDYLIEGLVRDMTYSLKSDTGICACTLSSQTRFQKLTIDNSGYTDSKVLHGMALEAHIIMVGQIWIRLNVYQTSCASIGATLLWRDTRIFYRGEKDHPIADGFLHALQMAAFEMVIFTDLIVVFGLSALHENSLNHSVSSITSLAAH